MTDQIKMLIFSIEERLIMRRWERMDNAFTLYFLPTKSPGDIGEVRRGDSTLLVYATLKYNVFIKQELSYLTLIDEEKEEVTEYRILELNIHKGVFSLETFQGASVHFSLK